MSEIKPVWRPVVGYEGLYEVSDTGLVRRLAVRDSCGRQRKGRVLRQVEDRRYRRVTLSKDSRPLNVSVHKLVAEAFLGVRPDGCVINHKDGVKANNQPGNLEYVTQAENNRHAVALGLKASGERHGQTRLSTRQVEAVRVEFSRGLSIARLTALTGMSPRQVSRIVRKVSRRVG